MISVTLVYLIDKWIIKINDFGKKEWLVRGEIETNSNSLGRGGF